MLRWVSVEERDKTIKDNEYYDQRLQAYLVTDLSQDVEATVRVQSITPWGMETSTTPLTTRYPNANGNVWVQNAFVRLPNFWKGRITLTAGRQPLQWGDGAILTDDDLGMNAVRLQVKSPWRALEFDMDAFTARITEGLTSTGDTNLHGALLGYDRESIRWEFMALWEHSDAPQNYEMGAETAPVRASVISRQIFGVRAKTNLKDAYIKGEYYLQQGDVKRLPNAVNVKLGGTAYLIGLGGKSNTQKFGRFGAVAEYAVGDGDKVSTGGKDEAFRAPFASRWSGLERKGYGRYFAATFSDAYSPSDPFGPASASNDGLPPGTSGIQSIRFGMESTPLSKWTFIFDYFQYKAQKNLVGPKELGTEFDYSIVYRHSGLVNMKIYYSDFRPGNAFEETTKKDASWSGAELEIKF